MIGKCTITKLASLRYLNGRHQPCFKVSYQEQEDQRVTQGDVIVHKYWFYTCHRKRRSWCKKTPSIST